MGVCQIDASQVNVDKKVDNPDRKEICVHASFCLSLVAQKLIGLKQPHTKHTEGEI